MELEVAKEASKKVAEWEREVVELEVAKKASKKVVEGGIGESERRAENGGGVRPAAGESKIGTKAR